MSGNFVARLAGRLGAVLLFATAGLHATGIGLARAGAAEVSEPFLAAAFVPVWLFASVHWLAFGVVAMVLAGVSDWRAQLTLFVLGGGLMLDAGLMATSVGAFIGTIFIGVCGGLLALSAGLAGREAAPLVS